jgi:hypothetical protein
MRSNCNKIKYQTILKLKAMNRRIIFFMPMLVLLFSFLYITEKGSQRAYYECTEPLKIDTSLFPLKKGQVYFHFNQSLKPKGLKAKGFLWMEDTPKDYFTAYLINTSDATFNAKRQDGSLIMIQEAMDAEGKWQPIEYWVYSGCGNSYFDPLVLTPGNYVMIPIKEYKGSFKTKFRLKMKKDTSLFYSDTFEGSIDKSQFEKETKQVNGILYHGPANYLDDK